jgi:8-oxo-dGTP diphosphatase
MIKVVGALIKNDSKLFLAKRQHGSLAGCWEFPGGKINKNESEEDAIIREIKEELNLTIKPINRTGEFAYDYPFGRVELVLYECRVLSPIQQLESDGSHDFFQWFTIEEALMINLAPLDKLILNHLHVRKT